MTSANDVASLIIARSGSFLTAMQVQKLLYYVQAWHLAITDEPIFTEQIKAWADGPVVPQVWHLRKEQSTRAAANQDISELDFSDLVSDLVDLVVGAYGSMSGDELSALTHAERPWVEARGDVPAGEQCTDAIPRGAMAVFYREHRKLGGRTAADLAAGGVHLRAANANPEPLDIDSFLRSLGDEFRELPEDEFGGGNLEQPSDEASGIETARRRAYLSA